MTDEPQGGSPSFTWTTVDLEAAIGVLADVTDEHQEVSVLTDEELVALDGLQHDQIVPTPWLDEQEFGRAELGGIALRGLIARGLVALAPKVTPEGEVLDELELTATGEITGALMLRRTAQAILRLEKQSNAGTRWIYCYVHAGRGVLIEDIDPNGLHVFGATTVPGAAEYVRALINFSDASGAVSKPVTYTTAEFESLEREPEPFSGAEGIGIIGVYQQDTDRAATAVVYAGPERLGLLIPSDNGTYEVSGITDARLREVLLSALTVDGPADSS